MTMASTQVGAYAISEATYCNKKDHVGYNVSVLSLTVAIVLLQHAAQWKGSKFVVKIRKRPTQDFLLCVGVFP